MDIQSNTVSGSPLFDQFEQGTGDEVYPDYRPYVIAYEKHITALSSERCA